MIFRKRLCALFLAGGMIFLSGCDKVVELTAEEEEIVTLYAAKVVSKHNVRLSQGLVRYRKQAAEGEEAGDEAEEEATEEVAADETEEVAADTEESVAEDKPEEAAEEETAAVTLNDAFGIDGIEFKYNKADTYNELQGQNSYIEAPDAGKKYIGISYDVTNTSNDEIELSILTIKTAFTATLGDEKEKAKSLAILPDDLPTYVGNIKAGETKTLSIYFEFSEEAVADLSSLGLTAEIDGKKSEITLK